MHITSTKGEQLDTVEEDKKVLKDISIYFISPYRHVLWHNQHRATTTTEMCIKNISFCILFKFDECFYALMSNFALSPSTKAAENTREHVPLSTDPHRHASKVLETKKDSSASCNLTIVVVGSNVKWIFVHRQRHLNCNWSDDGGRILTVKHRRAEHTETLKQKFMLRRELWIFIVFSREFSVHVIFCRHKCGEQKLFGNVQQCRNSSQVLGVNKKWMHCENWKWQKIWDKKSHDTKSILHFLFEI